MNPLNITDIQIVGIEPHSTERIIHDYGTYRYGSAVDLRIDDDCRLRIIGLVGAIPVTPPVPFAGHHDTQFSSGEYLRVLCEIEVTDT